MVHGPNFGYAAYAPMGCGLWAGGWALGALVLGSGRWGLGHWAFLDVVYTEAKAKAKRKTQKQNAKAKGFQRVYCVVLRIAYTA
jgi:hypothetical protein